MDYMDDTFRGLVRSRQEEMPRVKRGGWLSLRNIGVASSGEVIRRQRMICEILGAGWSLSTALSRSLVRRGLYDKWLREDAGFAERVSWAIREKGDYLEDLAFVRAHENDSVLMKLLEAERSEKFRPRGGGSGDGVINVQVVTLFKDGEERDGGDGGVFDVKVLGSGSDGD